METKPSDAHPDPSIPIGEAGRWVQKEFGLARPISRASFERWFRRGIRGQRLATITIGSRRYVRIAELRRFIESFNRATEEQQ